MSRLIARLLAAVVPFLVTALPGLLGAQTDTVIRQVSRRVDRDVVKETAVRREVNLARDRERLREADVAEVPGANAADALDARFADDVVLLLQGEPVLRGREAARAALTKRDGFTRGTTRSWPIRLDVAADGSLGYSFGYTETRVSTDSGPQTIVGKYISLWAKQADGSWRVAAHVRSPRRPGAAQTAPPAGFESPTGAPSRGRQAGRPVDVGAEREAVMAADRAFADSGARDVAAAFARFLSPDGAMLGSDAAMVWGRDAVRAGFADWPANRRLVWGPVLGGVSSTGDLGFTVGEAETIALDQPGTPAVTKSKYLTIWRKQADGTWRYVVDGGNGRP